jgi:hypothetical protein
MLVEKFYTYISKAVMGNFASFPQTRLNLQLSIGLGWVIYNLQQERGQALLYLSPLSGLETRTNLKLVSKQSDEALNDLFMWPGAEKEDVRPEFASKEAFVKYLSQNRKRLDQNSFSAVDAIDLYTDVINVFSLWFKDYIRTSNFAPVWKTLVAYQKLVSLKNDVGLERAIGSVYYVDGGFLRNEDYVDYNLKVHTSKARYAVATLYLTDLPEMVHIAMEKSTPNLSAQIDAFRIDIQRDTPRDVTDGTQPSFQMARCFAGFESQGATYSCLFAGVFD